MKKFMSSLQAVALTSAVVVSAVAASKDEASAQNYDIDCKVILCLAGGFPSGCGDAKSHMLKRLKRGKSPFGFCSFGSGGTYDGTDVEANFINDYDCPEGTNLRRPFGSARDGGGSSQAFCYTHTSVRNTRDNGQVTTYHGKTFAQPVNYQLQITVEGGTDSEFVSPVFRININSGYVSQRPAA